ncbi:MAG: hypothetical protein OXH81_19680 [Gemmatimonadetes bacterium]|nr:hypothetical protein [Gemmatimonadota bacterium]
MMGRGEGEAVEVDWDRRGGPLADVEDLVHGEVVEALFLSNRWPGNFDEKKRIGAA